MREKLQRFMAGRYGVDSFSRFLSWTSMLLLLLSIFILGAPLYTLAILILIYSYYRTFSKNYAKRSRENEIYMRYTAKIRLRFQKFKYHMSIRQTHHLYTCSQCKQMIKIPRGKGKIEITCPKCQNKFIKKS